MERLSVPTGVCSHSLPMCCPSLPPLPQHRRGRKPELSSSSSPQVTTATLAPRGPLVFDLYCLLMNLWLRGKAAVTRPSGRFVDAVAQRSRAPFNNAVSQIRSAFPRVCCELIGLIRFTKDSRSTRETASRKRSDGSLPP